MNKYNPYKYIQESKEAYSYDLVNSIISLSDFKFDKKMNLEDINILSESFDLMKSYLNNAKLSNKDFETNEYYQLLEHLQNLKLLEDDAEQIQYDDLLSMFIYSLSDLLSKILEKSINSLDEFRDVNEYMDNKSKHFKLNKKGL